MSPIRITNSTLARRITLAVLGLCLTAAVVTYVMFQARFLIEGPQVTLTGKPDIIQHERQIVLEGIAKNITAISVNGRSIVTDEHGTFREPIVLENGYTVIRIDARDRYGRTTTVERSFVYRAHDEDDASVSLLRTE